MFTKIECGECGGFYRFTGYAGFYLCTECGHTVTDSDLLPNMEEGESLTVWDGVLGYVTKEV